MQKYFAIEIADFAFKSRSKCGLDCAPRFKCKRLPPSWRETVIRPLAEQPGQATKQRWILEKPTRGENLDAIAPRINCKTGTLLRDLTANDIGWAEGRRAKTRRFFSRTPQPCVPLAVLDVWNLLLLFRLSVRADPLETGAWLKTSSRTKSLWR
jgi:hypothetical protein